MIAALIMSTWLSIAATRPIESQDLARPPEFVPPKAADAAMLESFLTNDDRRIRSEAAWALGDARIPALAPVLAGRLARETNEWVRSDLLQALGKLPPLTDPSEIARQLHDADPAVRRWCLWTLGEWKASAATPAVAELASRDDVETVRAAAAEALGKFDPSNAEPALLPAFKDRSPTVRQAAAKATGSFRTHSQAGLKALIDSLQDPDPLMRAAAVASLGTTTNTTVDGPVSEMAADGFAFVRRETAVALRSLGATNHTATAIRLLADQDQAVRTEAAATLGSFRDPRSIAPLLARLPDPNRSVRQAVARALVDLKMADDVVPSLANEMDDRANPGRAEAAWALGEYRDARAVPVLLKSADDADRDVSLKSIQALGKIGAPTAVETLLTQLGNPSPDHRAMAAWSLGEIRDRRAVGELIRLLADRSPGPQVEAATAAGKINDERFVTPLLALLADARAERFPARAAAAWALGQRGDARALPRLRQLLVDRVIQSPTGPPSVDHEIVRMNCLVAITQIARALPNAGQLPEVTAFLEKCYVARQFTSNDLDACCSECLEALTGKPHPLTPYHGPPRSYFVHSVD